MGGLNRTMLEMSGGSDEMTLAVTGSGSAFGLKPMRMSVARCCDTVSTSEPTDAYDTLRKSGCMQKSGWVGNIGQRNTDATIVSRAIHSSMSAKRCSVLILVLARAFGHTASISSPSALRRASSGTSMRTKGSHTMSCMLTRGLVNDLVSS